MRAPLSFVAPGASFLERPMAGVSNLFTPTIRLVIFFVDINSECDFVNNRCIALRLVTFTIGKREGGTVSHSCELMQCSPAK